MLYGDFEELKREMGLMRRAILAIDEFLEAVKPGQPTVPDSQEYRRAYYKARGEIDEYREVIERMPK